MPSETGSRLLAVLPRINEYDDTIRQASWYAASPRNKRQLSASHLAGSLNFSPLAWPGLFQLNGFPRNSNKRRASLDNTLLENVVIPLTETG